MYTTENSEVSIQHISYDPTLSEQSVHLDARELQAKYLDCLKIESNKYHLEEAGLHSEFHDI
jgi:hypothetical protein